MGKKKPKPSSSLARQLKIARKVNAEQAALIDQQQEIIEQLQRDVAMLKRSQFGNRRERFTGIESSDRQPFLFETAEIPEPESSESPTASDETGAPSGDQDEANDADDDPEPCSDSPPKRRTTQGRRRRVLPECLRREKVVERLPATVTDADRERGRCFEKKVGERVEIQTEVIVVEQYVEVLAIDNEDQTESKLMEVKPPPRILRSFAGDSLLAALAVHRFCDHLPYYRLEEVLNRSQLDIHRATQTRWLNEVGKQLKPITDLMRKKVLQCRVIQADETPVARLAPSLGTTSKSYLWAILGTLPHSYITFSYTDDRSAAGPDEFFRDFKGTLAADAYVCYERLKKTMLGRVNLSACLVHARRKFEAVHDLGPTNATRAALTFFHQLFDMEDQWLTLTPDERRTERQLHARPLMDELKQWLDKQDSELRPKHPLRPAINYMLKRWDHFTRFLSDGLIPTHNNASEQAVKLPVIGKKNWLFFGSSQGGRTAAIYFTLMATCRQLHINPVRYLTDVFGRLPRLDTTDETALTPLLPDQWLKLNPDAVVPQRQSEAQKR